MNDVLVKIRKIVREGFNLPGKLVLFAMLSGGSWMVWQALEWFWVGHGFSRAVIGPIRMRAFSPEGRFSFYLAAEIE